MAIWLVRAGRSGEFESNFLNNGRIYISWERLNNDLRMIKDKKDLYKTLLENYPQEKKGSIRNWTSQLYLFSHEMKIGDWVVLPSKFKAAIHFGEIKGEYEYHPDAVTPLFPVLCGFSPLKKPTI